MSRIKSKFVAITLNVDKVTKRQQTRIINAITFGIKAWVREAESIIPVYSGASRASLDQIASVVKVDVSTTPTTNAIKRLGPAAIASRQAQARSDSRGEIQVNKDTIIFFYESTLQWLVDNELGNANDAVARSGNLITPIPYNFIDRANQKATEVIQRRLKGRTIDLRGILDFKTITC